MPTWTSGAAARRGRRVGDHDERRAAEHRERQDPPVVGPDERADDVRHDQPDEGDRSGHAVAVPASRTMARARTSRSQLVPGRALGPRPRQRERVERPCAGQREQPAEEEERQPADRHPEAATAEPADLPEPEGRHPLAVPEQQSGGPAGEPGTQGGAGDGELQARHHRRRPESAGPRQLDHRTAARGPADDGVLPFWQVGTIGGRGPRRPGRRPAVPRRRCAARAGRRPSAQHPRARRGPGPGLGRRTTRDRLVHRPGHRAAGGHRDRVGRTDRLRRTRRPPRRYAPSSGPTTRRSLPFSMLAGAALVVRRRHGRPRRSLPPSEVQVGIMAAAVGVPVFIAPSSGCTGRSM